MDSMVLRSPCFSQTRFGLGLFNEGGVGHQPLRLPAGRNPGPDGGNRRGRLDRNLIVVIPPPYYDSIGFVKGEGFPGPGNI